MDEALAMWAQTTALDPLHPHKTLVQQGTARQGKSLELTTQPA